MISHSFPASAALSVLFALLFNPVPCCAASESPAGYSEDARRVIKYISTLSRKSVGKRIDGVTLQDGTKRLKNHRFLGRAANLKRGQRVYLFESNGKRLAYMWVESGGQKIALSECESEHEVLSPPNVFTFTEVSAGDGVVISHCPAPAWFD